MAEHIGEAPIPGHAARSFTYDAFLSYSHDDEAVAAGIHKGLHRIGRRLGKLHALRVFRDTTELSANADLWGSVTAAMDRARYLIVVLSRRAAASEWVDKEVAYWLATRGPEQLLIVLAEGHVDWDETSGRLAPDRSDVAVPVLTEVGVLPHEPLYVDVSGDAPWDPAAPAFRDKLLDLAAPVHGKPKYELSSEDVREQRRFKRLRGAAIAALAILTVVSVVAATYAFIQRGTAEEERNNAIAMRLVSEANSMLAGVQAGGAEQAVQQILAAQRIASHPDTGALFTAVVKLGHTLTIAEAPAAVLSVAASPDGRLIASGAADGTVQVREAGTGEAPRTFAGPRPGVLSVAFSADGRRIVTGDLDGAVQVWNAATGAPLGQPMTGHARAVASVAFSPDDNGRRIVSGSWDGTIRVWDADTGETLRDWNAATGDPDLSKSDQVQSVAFSPDGRRIVSGTWSDRVQVWNADTGAPMLAHPITPGTHAVDSVAFSPNDNGSRIVSGSWDGSVRVWDADTGDTLLSKPMTGHTGRVLSVAFSPDGGRIASGGQDGTVRVWDANTAQPVGDPLTGYGLAVNSVAFLRPDGEGSRVISGSDDETLRIWDTAANDVLRGHADTVRSVAFSPNDNGKRVVSGSADTSIRVWDVATGESRLHIPDTMDIGQINSVEFSPDGHRIVSGGYDNMIRLWNAQSGGDLGSLRDQTDHSCPKNHTKGRSHDDQVTSVVFSPDGTKIASGSLDGTVKVWQADSIDQPASKPITICAVDYGVSSVAFGPDSSWIVWGDGGVQRWDAATRKPRFDHPITDVLEPGSRGVRSVAVGGGDHGPRIVSGGADGIVRVWDADSGKQLGDLSGHIGPVLSVAISPDRRWIVSGGQDKTVRVWDAHALQPLGLPLTGHTAAVTSVAFNPDGNRIVSGSSDRTVRLWPLPDQSTWTELLCAKLTTNINPEQWNRWVSPGIPYAGDVCPGLPESKRSP